MCNPKRWLNGWTIQTVAASLRCSRDRVRMARFQRNELRGGGSHGMPWFLRLFTRKGWKYFPDVPGCSWVIFTDLQQSPMHFIDVYAVSRQTKTWLYSDVPSQEVGLFLLPLAFLKLAGPRWPGGTSYKYQLFLLTVGQSSQFLRISCWLQPYHTPNLNWVNVVPSIR